MSKKYSSFDYGPMEEWEKHIFLLPAKVKEETGIGEFPGKRFCKEDLNLHYMDFSINKFPPGLEMPFTHQHRQQEELYFFIKGEGEMYIDGELVPFTAGTAIRVDQAALRALRNTNLAEPLYYLCFRAQGGEIDDVETDVPEPEMFSWDDIDE